MQGGRRDEGFGGGGVRVVGGVGLPHYSRSAGVPAAAAPLPAALARPRRRTESRPTSFISPAVTEVTRGRSSRLQRVARSDRWSCRSAQPQSVSFVFHLGDKKKKRRRPQALFPRRPPPGRLYGYVRRHRHRSHVFEFLLLLDETANTAP